MGAVKKAVYILIGAIVSFLLWPLLPLRAAQTQPLSVESAVVVTDDGFSQIKVKTAAEQETLVTSDSLNHTQPAVAEEYVVWLVATDAGNSVVRFHAPTQTYLTVTRWGVNQNPVVDAAGRVAWQTWRDERWQMQWFDGQSVQLALSDTQDIEPVWYKGSIYFSRKSKSGEWTVGRVNVETREVEEVVQAPSEVLMHTKAGRVSDEVLPTGVVTQGVVSTPAPNPPQEVISDKPQTQPDVVVEVEVEESFPIQNEQDLTDQQLTE